MTRAGQLRRGIERKMKHDEQKICELIKRRRFQMMTHSYLYYILDENRIDDYTWTMWAKELYELQRDYPALSDRVSDYREEFRDWTGESGQFLKFDDRTKRRCDRILSEFGLKGYGK